MEEDKMQIFFIENLHYLSVLVGFVCVFFLIKAIRKKSWKEDSECNQDVSCEFFGYKTFRFSCIIFWSIMTFISLIIFIFTTF